MRKLLLSLLTLTTAIIIFQNCGNYAPSESQLGSMKLLGTTTGNPKLSFENISQEVFQPHCLSCHNSNGTASHINYDSHENTINSGELSLLLKHYERHHEPSRECGTISPEQMDLIVEWINLGAPL